MWWSPSARCYSMSRRRVYGNRQRNNIAQVSRLSHKYVSLLCKNGLRSKLQDQFMRADKVNRRKTSAEQHMQTRRAASRLLGCVVNPFFVRPRSQCFIISQIDRARGAAFFWYKLRGSIAKSHNNI